MGEEGFESPEFLASVDPTGMLDAALLLKRTGTVISAWTRREMPLDVVSVMSATLLGSVETLVEAMHCHSPRVVKVASEACQMIATKLASNSVLVLIAPASAREAQLQAISHGIERRLAPRAATHANRAPVAANPPRP